MKQKLSNEEKRDTRALVRSHLKQMSANLRAGELERARRNLSDAEKLYARASQSLPPKSQMALYSAVFDAKKKLEKALADHRQLWRDSGVEV